MGWILQDTVNDHRFGQQDLPSGTRCTDTDVCVDAKVRTFRKSLSSVYIFIFVEVVVLDGSGRRLLGRLSERVYNDPYYLPATRPRAHKQVSSL